MFHNCFADVLALPVLAGNPRSALARPDTIVLPGSMARKYFGRDAPLGETLTVDGTHLVSVTAIIEDLPANATHLQSGIFISGLASPHASPGHLLDAVPLTEPLFAAHPRARLWPSSSCDWIGSMRSRVSALDFQADC